MGAAALILDEQGRLLIVKPTYRADWLMPGGMVEEDESPRQACIREVKEEIGLDLDITRLLCVDYTARDGDKTEALQFMFYGGILDGEQIQKIRLPFKELSEYRFLTLEDAQGLLNRKLAKRVPFALRALEDKTTSYLEEGR